MGKTPASAQSSKPRQTTVFKFVVGEPAELVEVREITERLAVTPARIWIMPEATGPEELLAGMRTPVQPVADRGWSLSGRLQVLLWAGERGR